MGSRDACEACARYRRRSFSGRHAAISPMTNLQVIDAYPLLAAHREMHTIIGAHRTVLADVLRPNVSLAVWRRGVPTPISNWLSQCSAEEIATGSCDIDISIPAACVPASLCATISAQTAQQQAGVLSLSHDAAELAGLMARISGNPNVRLRLEWVTHQQCASFHADRMPFRLLCTYHGPGTEWVSVATAERLTSPDSMPPADEIHRLTSGDVAIMRGSSSRDHSSAPLKHRSPPVNFPSEWRLFLAIDPASPSGQVSSV